MPDSPPPRTLRESLERYGRGSTASEAAHDALVDAGAAYAQHVRKGAPTVAVEPTHA